VAIRNNWKEIIIKHGISQNTVADAIGINRGWFSKITNGSAILSDEERRRADEALSAEFGFTVADAYDPAMFDVLYGEQLVRLKRSQKPAVQVRILGDIAERIDELVDEGTFESRNKAVNSILRRGLQHEASGRS
jgi:transcriptional regulator with XRE-family HTH domain